MTFVEGLLLAAAGALYAGAVALAWKGGLRSAWLVIGAAALLHLGSAVTRWIGVGHPPVFGTFEATLAASWFLMLFVAASFRSVHGHFRLVVLTAVPIALLLLCYGIAVFGTARMPLTISERSLWVDFHALFSWLAFAPLTLASCLSGYRLWATRRRGLRRPAAFDSRAASDAAGARASSLKQRLDIIDELGFRYVAFGYVSYSVMFATGSYYSSILFGSWWRWDPAFSIGLIVWLLVGLYIHLRLFYNWHGRRAARLYLAIFVAICFLYWGLAYLPVGVTFHVFDLDVSVM